MLLMHTMFGNQVFRGSHLGRNSGVNCTGSPDLYHTLRPNQILLMFRLANIAYCNWNVSQPTSSLIKSNLGHFHIVSVDRGIPQWFGDRRGWCFNIKPWSWFSESKNHQPKSSSNNFCILPPGGAWSQLSPCSWALGCSPSSKQM